MFEAMMTEEFYQIEKGSIYKQMIKIFKNKFKSWRGEIRIDVLKEQDTKSLDQAWKYIAVLKSHI